MGTVAMEEANREMRPSGRSPRAVATDRRGSRTWWALSALWSSRCLCPHDTAAFRHSHRGRQLQRLRGCLERLLAADRAICISTATRSTPITSIPEWASASASTRSIRFGGLIALPLTPLVGPSSADEPQVPPRARRQHLLHLSPDARPDRSPLAAFGGAALYAYANDQPSSTSRRRGELPDGDGAPAALSLLPLPRCARPRWWRRCAAATVTLLLRSA